MGADAAGARGSGMMCVEAVWCNVSGSGVKRGGGLNRRWDDFFQRKNPHMEESY